MTKQTSVQCVNQLRRVLRLNATSCILFGSSFVLWSDSISEWIGNRVPLVLLFVGLGLLFNGLHLVVASRRERIRFFEVSYFALGDALWVITTIALILLGLGITTMIGVVIALLVAMMVGTFGGLQIGLLRVIWN